VAAAAALPAAAPAAAAPTHAAAAAAAAAVWWFQRQPDFPSIAHKVVAALAVPGAIFWFALLLGRPLAGVGPRCVTAAAAFLMGYCASHWVALGAV
jgi:hypothetical protein